MSIEEIKARDERGLLAPACLQCKAIDKDRGELLKILERVEQAIIIKPHLVHPIGGNDCERVRVYKEIKLALMEVDRFK